MTLPPSSVNTLAQTESPSTPEDAMPRRASDGQLRSHADAQKQPGKCGDGIDRESSRRDQMLTWRFFFFSIVWFFSIRPRPILLVFILTVSSADLTSEDVSGRFDTLRLSSDHASIPGNPSLYDPRAGGYGFHAPYNPASYAMQGPDPNFGGGGGSGFNRPYMYYPNEYEAKAQPQAPSPSLNPSPPYMGMHRPSNTPSSSFWTSPPMSPVMAPVQQPFFGVRQRQSTMDEYNPSRGVYYPSMPPSAWSQSYGFPYNQAQPQPQPQPQPSPDWRSPQPSTWQPPKPRPAKNQTRMSWSGPSRAAELVAAKAKQELERKEYHPQAPARRSDWVMWVGNVPSNVSHEELWKFFNSTVPYVAPTAENPHPNDEPWRGPSSIFLISRSSCAFVNFSSQADLDRAVPFFNGRPLRPWDARCPRMVCRVRKKDDDLRAGVGAQRGVGIHRAWVRDQEKEAVEKEQADVATPLPGASVPPSPAVLEHPPEGEGRRRDSIVASVEQIEQGREHKSSASYASTNSSFLVRNFPRRYFILKSLTTIDLEESVATGTWKTQRHNEPILDQALRTSQDVILIFGANRSGEFYGYAKMVEPINKEKAAERAERAAVAAAAAAATAKVPPVVRNPSLSSVSTTGTTGSNPSKQWSTPERIREEESEVDERARASSDPLRPKPFLTTSSQSTMPPVTSPGQLTEEEEARLAELTAKDPADHSPGESKTDPPADKPHTVIDDHRAQTLDPHALRKDEDDRVVRKDTIGEPEPQPRKSSSEHAPDSWGPPFRIQWIKVKPLPFGRTRHLRNPWNGDREVKVSRDGTEIEPNVGSQLLAEWDKDEEGQPVPSSSSGFGIPTDVAFSALY